MKKLHFLTAGIPRSVKGKKSIISGLHRIKELNIDGMELEFVRGISGKPDYYVEVGKTAKELNLLLTAHAPYYINLNSDDEDTLYRSRQHIINSARILSLAGGWSLVFHAGYYLKQDSKTTLQNIQTQLNKIQNQLKKEKTSCFIRPELMGKYSQFGSLDEIIQICKNTGLSPCIDFSHLHAREQGLLKTYDEFASVFSKMEKSLGSESLKNVHLHLSGVEYNEQGEKKHTLLRKSELNYTAFAKVLKDFEIAGALVYESPNVEGDLLLLKKIYQSL